MALYHCTYQWPREFEEGHTPQERLTAFRHVFANAEAEDAIGERLHAWYQYPGEWAGVLIIEAATVEELNQLLLPYTKLTNWTVKPLLKVDYQQARRQAIEAGGPQTPR